MKRRTAVIVALILDVIDISVSTVLYCHGSEFGRQFKQGILHFTYTQSMFDVWILNLIRLLIYLGSLLALIYNPAESIRRIGKSKRLTVILMVMFWMYSIIKLLVVSESAELKDIWFWAYFAWSFPSAILFLVHFAIIRSLKLSRDVQSLLINESTSDDRATLLSNGDCPKEKEEDKDDDKEPKADKVTVSKLIAYTKPDLPYLLLAFLFLLIASVGEIFIPFFTGQVIDSIVIDKSQSAFVRNIVIMSVISFGSAIASGLRSGTFTYTMARLNIRLRNMLFSSLVRQEIGFFDKVKTGDIISRLTTDTTVMSDTISLNMNVFLRNMVKGIGTVVFMFKLSWRLSLLTVVGIPIVVFVSELYGKYYQELSEKVQDSLAKANHVAEEVVSTIRTVRSFANEGGERDRYKTSLSNTYKLNKKQAIAFTGFRWCTQIFELALTVGVLYYGGHLVLLNIISGGTLVSFILYQLELGNCIDEIGDVYTGLMQALGASAKVFEYMHRDPEIDNAGAHAPTDFKGQIRFDKVSFAYPTREDNLVLKDVSFTVNPGEVVALVGPSGGGKSSCINLIQHFYRTMKGQILLDSVPIQEYDHKYVHNKIALVGQEPILYARSIEDNIRYGMDDHSVDEKTVQKVAEMANAHQFVVEMKDKYKTECGEKGIQLSGGQKQRIAIARALIRDPSILLLDEATSALDSESEFVVQQAIYKNLSGRTVVIIAHRLSTVEKADRIIVIDKGQVIEQGKHSQLLAQNGLYARLVQRQLLGFDEASVMRNSSNDDDASCKRRHSASVSSGEHVNTNTSSQAVTRKHSFSGSPIKYFRRKSSSPKQEFYSPPSRGSPTFYDLTDK